MAKPQPQPQVSRPAVPTPTPDKPAVAPASERLAWPTSPKDIPSKPRLFRIQRLNAFEWQAYVTEDDRELPIGKPDLFDILRNKVSGLMRAEGQVEFLEQKRKAEAPKPAGKPDAQK